MPRKSKPPVETALTAPPPAAEDADVLRVEQVVRWLLSGARDADVLHSCLQEWPKAKVGPLIAAAIESLAKSADFDHDVVKGWCFEATKDVYRRMLEIGDLVGALRAIKQLSELAS